MASISSRRLCSIPWCACTDMYLTVPGYLQWFFILCYHYNWWLVAVIIIDDWIIKILTKDTNDAASLRVGNVLLRLRVDVWFCQTCPTLEISCWIKKSANQSQQRARRFPSSARFGRSARSPVSYPCKCSKHWPANVQNIGCNEKPSELYFLSCATHKLCQTGQLTHFRFHVGASLIRS